MPIDGWAAGTKGTIIELLSDTHALVEINGTDALETLIVPYSAMTATWSPEHEHAISC